VSFSIEYQRGDAPPENEPLLDPRHTPPFLRRLGLVGKQILQYRHMYALDSETVALGERLRSRFPIQEV
jgi:hypothetical protein